MEDVAQFRAECLPNVELKPILRAARVAKDIRSYDEVARGIVDAVDDRVGLTDGEKEALRAEKNAIFSQRGMFVVILTVSLASFLQGFVQSSINGASLYPQLFISAYEGQGDSNWKLGAANSAHFFAAAVIGCWVSLPINDRIGRRGSMAVAAILILISSAGAAGCNTWVQLFGVRIINGIGMGIKAVSTPILASETSVGYWRGTSILAWQLVSNPVHQPLPLCFHIHLRNLTHPTLC